MIATRNGTHGNHNHHGNHGDRNGSGAVRVATYSPGMVGFGHIRRNASIAQALRASELRPAIVMIAEAWQAGTLPMPEGVDCVTLPSLRKESEGIYASRFADMTDQDILAVRGRVIRGAMQGFHPDVLIVDHLPRGAARELDGTLGRLRRRAGTRCVLGLRDVLQDRDTVQRQWSARGFSNNVRESYDAIWIYADPAAYDLARDCEAFGQFADRIRYTGYLDQRPRLELARPWTESLLSRLPEGRLALCVVGGGHDGDDLAEAFVRTPLPEDMFGIVVTGPYMSVQHRQRLQEAVREHPRMQVIDFLPEPIALVERADRVVAMGGYNTVCEVLSLEKHALIVPRVRPNREQWIRARRMRELGLIHVLHPDLVHPDSLGEWLAKDLGSPPASRSVLDFGGLDRIPGLLAELLEGPTVHSPNGTTRPDAEEVSR